MIIDVGDINRVYIVSDKDLEEPFWVMYSCPMGSSIIAGKYDNYSDAIAKFNELLKIMG